MIQVIVITSIDRKEQQRAACLGKQFNVIENLELFKKRIREEISYKLVKVGTYLDNIQRGYMQ